MGGIAPELGLPRWTTLARIWLVLIALSAPLFPGSASLAQSETSHLIVTGQFGSWKLGTSEWEALPVFTEALGPEFSSGTDPSFKSGRYYFWTSAGIKLVVGERGRVVGIFAWRRYRSPDVTKANHDLEK